VKNAEMSGRGSASAAWYRLLAIMRVLFSYGGVGDQAHFRLPRCEWHPGRITVLSAVGMSRRMAA